MTKMEIFVGDANAKTGKWRRVLVNVSVCLLKLHEIHFLFTFAPLSGVLKRYEDTKWYNVISNLKQFFD